MRTAVRSGRKLPRSLGALACAAVIATGCGDAQESRSTAGRADAPSAASASAAGSWREYFPPRPGYQCTFGAVLETGSISVASRQTQTVTSVRKAADGEHAVIRTRTVSTAPGVRPVTLTADNPYVFAKDGTLRAAPGVGTSAGLRVTYDGFQVFPSVPDLRRGRSAHSKVSMSVSATTEAMRRALASDLGGRGSFKADLAYDVKAAPRRRAIVTPAGRYTDVIGIAIELSAFHLRNAPSEVDAATRSVLRGLFDNGATSYYAKGVGLVLTEASGPLGTTSVRLRRCGQS
jgi:hypothetical protein